MSNQTSPNFGPDFSPYFEKISNYHRYQMVSIFIGLLFGPIILFTVNKWVGLGIMVSAIGTVFYYRSKIQQQRNLIDNEQKNHPFYDPETGFMDTSIKDSNQTINKERSTLATRPQFFFGDFIDPKEDYSFDNIILSEQVRTSVENGINKFMFSEFLNENWNFKSIEKLTGRNILNFFGMPGTGKTITAKAISFLLKKPLLLVNYAQLEEKWVGQTEKNIEKMFKAAKDYDAILFLDEADTLTSKRSEDNSPQARHINAARNVFMQELDKFNGVVIMTTNLFSNFDEAMLRRVCQNVKFELPDEEMREKIIRLHIPQEVPLEDVNFKELAKLTKGFSGGDIKNMAKEGMISALSEYSKKGSQLSQASLGQRHLISEMNKISASKKSYLKEDDRKEIGIRGN